MIRGMKPAAVMVPPGIWWVEVTVAVYVPSTVGIYEPCNDYRTWDGAIKRWQLVQNRSDGFNLYEFGSDEGRDEDGYVEVITALGPRVPEYSRGCTTE